VSILPGKPHPLGAHAVEEGVNFALFSANATSVTLCLFESVDDAAPTREIEVHGKTGSVWHCHVTNVKMGQLYGYRVDGPYEPRRGMRFNRNKVLLDPYAHEIGRSGNWDDSLLGYRVSESDQTFNSQDSSAYCPLARVAASSGADAGAESVVRPLQESIPWENTLIYEAHVRGLSMLHPDVEPADRGTYLGVIAPPILDHLKSLGVTSLQLLPVHSKFSEKHLADSDLTNYWGYNTLSYFAPEPSYASDPARAVHEFRAMVDGLHAAGIEVIIDVVFNHTAEGNRFGPTISYRGIDNPTYYRRNGDEPEYLQDFTGTGNTLDVRQPVVLQLITDALKYWKTEMGVDGFRFDLAPVLTRSGKGVDMMAPFFAMLREDPVLQRTKLIAEPWDLGPGGYQLGAFPEPFREWNAEYRDTVRRFWSSDAGALTAFATRFCGSSDLFEKRNPLASINLVTAHDGFTLRDLVSYEVKHNRANGEENRDGHEPNYSRNWGVEGESDNPDILNQRDGVRKSLMATLMLSQGVPMILGGDELSRTQAGNNNAYCQDNEISWINWSRPADDEPFLDYVRELTAFRKAHPTFSRNQFLRGGAADSRTSQVIWWHPEGRELQRGDWESRYLLSPAVILLGDRIEYEDAGGIEVADDTLLVVFNAAEAHTPVRLPSWGGAWTCCPPFSEATTHTPDSEIVVPPLSVLVLKADQHL